MALSITIEGDAGGGKSAVGRLIEELLVEHGFMVIANINGILPKDEASRVARNVSANDPRVVLNEVQSARSEATRG